MNAVPTAGNATEIALARSAAYGLLAHAFRYPDRAHWTMFSDRRRWQAWPETLNVYCSDAGSALRQIEERVLSPDPSHSVSIESVQADYSRLFGHAVKGGCPLYELEYGAGEVFQRVARLADLNGFYSAFGLALQSGMRERSDHVSVELEFMSVLAAKEGYALEVDESDGFETVRESAGQFLDAHLAGWLPSLARRIVDADPDGFYGAVGDFAAKFVHAECARHGVNVGSELLELRSADEDDETVQTCAAEQPGGGCPMTSDGPPMELS